MNIVKAAVSRAEAAILRVGRAGSGLARLAGAREGMVA